MSAPPDVGALRELHKIHLENIRNQFYAVSELAIAQEKSLLHQKNELARLAALLASLEVEEGSEGHDVWKTVGHIVSNMAAAL